MGLADFVAAVEARLAAVLEDPAVNLPIPKMAIGKDKLVHQDAPPRIVWVPQRGPVRGPHGQGGDGIANPRPLFTRHLGVEIRIWAIDPNTPDGSNDLAMVELYMQHLVAAAYDTKPGAFIVVSEDWPEDIQAMATRPGQVCSLVAELQFPLTREPDTYARIDKITSTTEVDPIFTA